MIFLLLSCGTDVSIMKIDEDTSVTIEDSNNIEDTAPAIPNGIAGYHHFYLKQIACPPCVGENQEITVTMNLQLHDSINDTHTSWIPEQGSCINNFSFTTPTINPTTLGETLNVYALHDLSLYQSQIGLYSTILSETEYDRDYNYSVFHGDSLLFNFQSLHGFDYVEPYTLLYVDPSYAFSTPISKLGPTFWWGPNNDLTQIFNITIAAYSWDGSQLLGYVSCSGANSGQLTIPGQYLSSFPSGSLATIHLTRHKITEQESNYFNSYIESHMEWEVIGTGYIE